MMISSRILTRGKIALVLVVVLALLGGALAASAQTSKVKGLDRKGMRAPVTKGIVVQRGTLRQGGLGQWLLDDTPLVFTDDSRVSRKGAGASYVALDDGEQALILGTRRGGSLVVTRVLMIRGNEAVSRGSFSSVKAAGELQMAPADAPR